MVRHFSIDLDCGAHLLECVMFIMVSRLPLRMLRWIHIVQLSNRGHDHLYIMSNWQCKNKISHHFCDECVCCLGNLQVRVGVSSL